MDHLTTIEGIPDRSAAIPGMAHFAGTGPPGKTCGDCVHRGYKRRSERETWSEHARAFVARVYKVNACDMFRRLTGKHGPPIEAGNRSCRHFAGRGQPSGSSA